MAAERRAVQAGVLAAAAVASCCVALWSLSPPPQAALVQRAPGAVQLAGAPAWAFKPTKFGPLRRKKWTASRYRVLALWEAAARSTESCMDAVNEIYPDARDDSCEDINRSMAMVQECMRNQRDGYQGLSDSKNGAWDALPQLVDMTHALSNSDREMVAVKLDKSAVFYTLARLEALHAGCHGLRPAKHHEQRTGQLTNPNGLADAVARVDHAIQYMRKVGGVQRETMPAGPGGEWSESAKASYEEPDAEPLHLRGDNGKRGPADACGCAGMEQGGSQCAFGRRRMRARTHTHTHVGANAHANICPRTHAHAQEPQCAHSNTHAQMHCGARRVEDTCRIHSTRARVLLVDSDLPTVGAGQVCVRRDWARVVPYMVGLWCDA